MMATAAIAIAAARTIRSKLLAMAAMSHWFGQWAMTPDLRENEQPFSQSAVCRVSLEVRRTFHDI